MARTRNRTAQTVTVDAVDELVTQLNTLDGIAFVRDAWLEKAPDNYGVVELQGEAAQLWADGNRIDSIWRIVVTAYIRGADDSIAYDVENKLQLMDADITQNITRRFDMTTGYTEWVWTVRLYGDLTREEPAPAPAESGGGD